MLVHFWRTPFCVSLHCHHQHPGTFCFVSTSEEGSSRSTFQRYVATHQNCPTYQASSRNWAGRATRIAQRCIIAAKTETSSFFRIRVQSDGNVQKRRAARVPEAIMIIYKRKRKSAYFEFVFPQITLLLPLSVIDNVFSICAKCSVNSTCSLWRKTFLSCISEHI